MSLYSQLIIRRAKAYQALKAAQGNVENLTPEQREQVNKAYSNPEQQQKIADEARRDAQDQARGGRILGGRTQSNVVANTDESGKTTYSKSDVATGTLYTVRVGDREYQTSNPNFTPTQQGYTQEDYNKLVQRVGGQVDSQRQSNIREVYVEDYNKATTRRSTQQELQNYQRTGNIEGTNQSQNPSMILYNSNFSRLNTRVYAVTKGGQVIKQENTSEDVLGVSPQTQSLRPGQTTTSHNRTITIQGKTITLGPETESERRNLARSQRANSIARSFLAPVFGAAKVITQPITNPAFRFTPSYNSDFDAGAYPEGSFQRELFTSKAQQQKGFYKDPDVVEAGITAATYGGAKVLGFGLTALKSIGPMSIRPTITTGVNAIGLGATAVYGGSTYFAYKMAPTPSEQGAVIGSAARDFFVFGAGASAGSKAAVKLGFKPAPGIFAFSNEARANKILYKAAQESKLTEESYMKLTPTAQYKELRVALKSNIIKQGASGAKENLGKFTTQEYEYLVPVKPGPTVVEYGQMNRPITNSITTPEGFTFTTQQVGKGKFIRSVTNPSGQTTVKVYGKPSAVKSFLIKTQILKGQYGQDTLLKKFDTNIKGGMLGLTVPTKTLKAQKYVYEEKGEVPYNQQEHFNVLKSEIVGLEKLKVRPQGGVIASISESFNTRTRSPAQRIAQSEPTITNEGTTFGKEIVTVLPKKYTYTLSKVNPKSMRIIVDQDYNVLKQIPIISKSQQQYKFKAQGIIRFAKFTKESTIRVTSSQELEAAGSFRRSYGLQTTPNEAEFLAGVKTLNQGRIAEAQANVASIAQQSQVAVELPKPVAAAVKVQKVQVQTGNQYIPEEFKFKFQQPDYLPEFAGRPAKLAPITPSLKQPSLNSISTSSFNSLSSSSRVVGVSNIISNTQANSRIVSNVPAVAQASRQNVAQEQAQSQQQQQRQLQQQRVIQQQKTLKMNPKLTIKTPEPTIPVIKIPSLDLNKAGQSQEPGYNTYIKVRQTKTGKGQYSSQGYKKINDKPLTKEGALVQGGQAVDKYSNRSFYIKPAGKPAEGGYSDYQWGTLKEKFSMSRRKGETKGQERYVERPKYAISSQEEKNDIPYEAARQSKKKKSFFGMRT